MVPSTTEPIMPSVQVLPYIEPSRSRTEYNKGGRNNTKGKLIQKFGDPKFTQGGMLARGKKIG